MASALSASVPRPFMTMLAPSLASACAMPSPMPEVEPVTTAVLPSSAIAILFEPCGTHPAAKPRYCLSCVGPVQPVAPLLLGRQQCAGLAGACREVGRRANDARR